MNELNDGIIKEPPPRENYDQVIEEVNEMNETD